MRLAQAFLFSLKEIYAKTLHELKQLSVEEDVEIMETLDDIHIKVMRKYENDYPVFDIPYEKIAAYVLFSFSDYLMAYEEINIDNILQDSNFHNLFNWKVEMEK